MNMGPVELFVLLVAAVSMLGPVVAGVYLATRLGRRHGEAEPTT